MIVSFVSCVSLSTPCIIAVSCATSENFGLCGVSADCELGHHLKVLAPDVIVASVVHVLP